MGIGKPTTPIYCSVWLPDYYYRITLQLARMNNENKIVVQLKFAIMQGVLQKQIQRKYSPRPTFYFVIPDFTYNLLVLLPFINICPVPLSYWISLYDFILWILPPRKAYPQAVQRQTQHRRAIYALWTARYSDGKSNRPFVSTSGVRKFQISQFSYCWASNKFFCKKHPYFGNNMRMLRWLWLFLVVGARTFSAEPNPVTKWHFHSSWSLNVRVSHWT